MMFYGFHGQYEYEREQGQKFYFDVEVTTKNDKVVVATFGPSTTKSAHDAGLQVVIEAPSPEFPSMTAALKSYLSKKK